MAAIRRTVKTEVLESEFKPGPPISGAVIAM
jgi:hypothetical protein